LVIGRAGGDAVMALITLVVRDAADRALTLETEGPSMPAKGKMAKYKDVIELKSDDYRRKK